MKPRKLLIITIAVFIFIHAAARLRGAETGRNKYVALDNGLKVLLSERDKLPLINIAFAVDVGAKDETKETNGLVHLLEHLVLLGSTESFKSEHLIKETRAKGFSMNAHTDNDLMTFEMSFPAKHLDFALDLSREKIFALKIIKEEMEGEKKIINEEINQILDDPESLGTSLVFRHLFQGHAYEHPIYGNKEIIQNATVNQLETFYKNYFTPANCSLSIVGRFKIEDVENKISEIFGEVKKSPPGKKEIPHCRPLKKRAVITEELDIEQAYVIIGFQAPAFNHEDHFPMNLLSFIIGKGFNPLLNFVLMGKRRYAEGFSTRYLPLKHGGVFLVYAITKPGSTKAAAREIIRFLKKSRGLRYAKEDFLAENQSFVFDYLESAKNQVRLSSEQAREDGLHTALSYARYLLLAAQGINHTNNLEKIRSKHLRDTATNYLSGKKYVTVYLLPAKKKK